MRTLIVYGALLGMLAASLPANASDCNPGRKDPPPKGKETDSTKDKPVYSPKF